MRERGDREAKALAEADAANLLRDAVRRAARIVAAAERTRTEAERALEDARRERDDLLTEATHDRQAAERLLQAARAEADREARAIAERAALAARRDAEALREVSQRELHDALAEAAAIRETARREAEAVLADAAAAARGSSAALLAAADRVLPASSEPPPSAAPSLAAVRSGRPGGRVSFPAAGEPHHLVVETAAPTPRAPLAPASPSDDETVDETAPAPLPRTAARHRLFGPVPAAPPDAPAAAPAPPRDDAVVVDLRTGTPIDLTDGGALVAAAAADPPLAERQWRGDYPRQPRPEDIDRYVASAVERAVGRTFERRRRQRPSYAHRNPW